MNFTRPPSLSEEEIKRIIKHMESNGAQVTVTDPRLTNVQNWVLASIGVGLIGAAGWLASNVSELNRSVAVLIQQNAYAQRINDNQDRRQDAFDDRLRAMERSK